MQASILSCKCNNGRMVTDLESGEVVCSSCGLVSLDRITDARAEWRTFDSENNNRQRVGSPNSLALHDMGLSTIIGSDNRDSAGRKLDSSMNSAMQRLRTWDARSRANTSTHRNLMRAFSELGSLKDKLGLSDAVVEKAAYIYRKAQERKLIRGRSVSSILAASIYMACREMGAPRSLRDMTEITNVKRNALSYCYRLLVLELDIKVPLIDPVKYITKIGNKARISEKTKRMAVDTMEEIIKKEITAGKNPVGLAAAVLYLSCISNNEKRTQKDIADAAGVTEVTVRNRFKDLKLDLYLN
ncbi:MAG: transcription initiation factor IIB [Nitrososphaerales archaeon]